MPLSYFERKALLPHGAVSRVAEELGCAVAKVSLVLGGHARDRDVETHLARLMRYPETGNRESYTRVSVTEAFGPAARKLHRKGGTLTGVA